MKFRYLIAALLLCFAVGCEQNELHVLSEIQVSPSYVGIDVNGGSSTVEITANDTWTVDEKSLPEWLTVSPMSGTAGKSSLTVSAEATKVTNQGEFKILCGGKTQIITVIQYAQKVDTPVSTVAQVLAGENGVTYRVTGVCSAYTGTGNDLTYGNWDITDETGTVYIYGTLDKNGETKGNPLAAWGIELGDVVTIEGPRDTYGTKVELVNVTVISITKSLLKLVGDAEYKVAKEESTLDVKLAYKGEDLKVNTDASWLTLAGIDVQKDTAYVKLHVAENSDDPRSAEVTFTSSKDGQSSEATITVEQAGESIAIVNDGTQASPYTPAEVIQLFANGEHNPDAEVYISGVISNIKSVSTKYGNAEFHISVDGTTEAEQLLVFRAMYLENAKFTAEDQIKVGDNVVILGKVSEYNGDPQIAQGNYIWSLNGRTTDKGISADNPFKVSEALQLIADGKYNKDQDVYISGTISEIEEVSASYGNATYYISDDGTTANQLYVFRGKYLNGEKFTAEDQIKVGDKVVILGKLTVYNESPQVNSGSSIVSIGGEGGNGGGDQGGNEGDNPGTNVTYTLIDKVANLTAGSYFISGYLTTYESSGKTYDWTANPYHVCTGASTDLYTTSYAFADGVLTKQPASDYNPATVTLETVSGKSNTYYVKFEKGYLYSSSCANRKLAVSETPVEWVATDNANGGVTLTTTMTDGTISLGTAGATSNLLRSYKNEATLKCGVVFFKQN